MESRLSSAQSSSFRRMKFSQSLPSIAPVVLEPSEFLKTYSKLGETRSEAQRAIRLNHLKNARIRSVDEDEFNRVIQHLEDVATMSKFPRQYAELRPLRPMTGFLEAGEYHYFTILLSGSTSPLHFDVRRDKGNVMCFFSFTSQKPGPEIHDYKFRTRYFKIMSKFSVFREMRGCLCVLAESETNVTICVAFGGDSMPGNEDLMARKSGLYTSIDIEESDESVKPTRSRASRVHSDVSEALSRSVNFIEANKAIRLKTPSRLRSLNNSRQLQAKLRRMEFVASRKERIIGLAEKCERRQEALAQAQYISKVLYRKAQFETGWMRLIFFAKMSFLLWSHFLTLKIAAVKNIKRSYACYRFQRMFRNQFPPAFDFKTRMIAMALNHLRLRHTVNSLFDADAMKEKLYAVIYSSYSDNKVAQAVRLTFSHILMIQRNWRRKRVLDNYYFRHIYDLWDKIVSDEEERWQKEYHQRKKDHKRARRFILISESVKNICVQKALKEAKEKYRDFHRAPERRSALMISFLPSYEELRQVIQSLAIEARSRKSLWIPYKASSLRGSLIDIKPH